MNVLMHESKLLLSIRRWSGVGHVIADAELAEKVGWEDDVARARVGVGRSDVAATAGPAASDARAAAARVRAHAVVRRRGRVGGRCEGCKRRIVIQLILKIGIS